MEINKDQILDEIEVRILGCLIEKELTTPDYYPLTLNALTNACNQKSNRNPVMKLDETDIIRGLDSLKRNGWIINVQGAGQRVTKYRHTIKNNDFNEKETAILCVLFLRGPQTTGELRTRTERLYHFNNLDEVHEVLDLLMVEPKNHIIKLPKQMGKKESRYMHLFCGTPEISENHINENIEPARLIVKKEDERISALEEEVSILKNKIESLRLEFDTFRKQFE